MVDTYRSREILDHIRETKQRMRARQRTLLKHSDDMLETGFGHDERGEKLRIGQLQETFDEIVELQVAIRYLAQDADTILRDIAREEEKTRWTHQQQASKKKSSDKDE